MSVVVVALLWVAALYRLLILVRGRTFVDINTAGAATCVAVAFTVTTLEPNVDAITGPYISDLIEHVAAVVAGALALLILVGLRTAHPTRRQVVGHLAVAAAVLLVMVAAFALAPIHQQTAGDLDEQFGTNTAIDVYRVVFNGYLIYVLGRCFSLSRRYAAQKGDAGRSAFLALAATGYIFALIYCATRIIYIAFDRLFDNQLAVIRAIGSIAIAVGLAILALGMIAPKIVRGFARMITATRGTYRLRPLWQDLTSAFPLVVLPTKTPWTIPRAELRYDRHLIEIAEGLAQARVPATGETHLATAAVQELAGVLQQSRHQWTRPEGISAAQLLPATAGPGEERSQLIDLADDYRTRTRIPAAAAASTEPMVRA